LWNTEPSSKVQNLRASVIRCLLSGNFVTRPNRSGETPGSSRSKFWLGLNDISLAHHLGYLQMNF
jgi:hypothetical protein